MAQTNYTPISLYNSTTASAVPTAGNLVDGELAVNITDGKLYYKDNLGVVKLLASSASAAGGVTGPVSSTDNAIARFDGVTGQLIQNSAVTIGDSGSTVIEVTDNTNAALRVTQLGTGNALLIEDSTNPDATPFVVDATGKVGIGTTAPTQALSIVGSVSITGTAPRITGTFSGASATDRVYVQTSTTNVATTFGVIPNGTATQSAVTIYNVSDPTNSPVAQFLITATTASINVTRNGTGAFLPLSVTTSNTERIRVTAAGGVGVGIADPETYDAKLAVNGNLSLVQVGQKFYPYYTSATNNNYITAGAGGEMIFGTGITAPAERIRIAATGALGLSGANYGTSGQVLTSAGSAAVPTWTTPVTTTSTDTLSNKTIDNATFINGYTEETGTANTGTAYTVDLVNGSLQILTLTGNCVFTFPTPTAGKSIAILLKQDATGGRTVTWPATVKWPSSTAPTITATASKMDKYVFVADGTNWIGSNAGQNYL